MTLREAAKVMEVPLSFAINRRIGYLQGEVRNINSRISEYRSELKRDVSEVTRLIYKRWMGELEEELKRLRREIARTQMLTADGPDGNLSCEEIERARKRPFRSIVKFIGNKAVCPFHQDKKPSLYLYEKQNKVWCFVCNKGWKTVDFLMERDGLSFPEAVRELQ